MLKKSKYNLILNNADGNQLIFNSLKCSFAELDDFSKSIFENIENTDELNDTKSLQIVQDLLENGFIIDNDFDELSYIDFVSKSNQYNNKNLLITIAPTTNCNMNCSYCYENLKPTTMDEEKQNKLITFIHNELLNNKNFTSLHITWYGGEPLLCKDTIFYLSTRLISLCNDLNITYHSKIITNGFLLDYSTALKLKNECKIHSAQITIDGLKETHNNRRRLKNNEDSFSTIMKNIDLCKDIIDINIRINIDSNNITEVQSLVDLLLSKKNWLNKVNFYFAPVQSTDKCLTCLKTTDFTDLINTLINHCLNKGYVNLLDNLYPSSKPVSCAAITTSQFIVDPNGYLYRCYMEIGNPSFSIGHIENLTSINMVENKNFLNWIKTKVPTKCTSCTIYPLCQGGCPFLSKSSALQCDSFFNNYNNILKLTYDQIK